MSHKYAYNVPRHRKNSHACLPRRDTSLSFSFSGVDTVVYCPALARQIATNDTTYFPAFTTCSTRSRDPRLAS